VYKNQVVSSDVNGEIHFNTINFKDGSITPLREYFKPAKYDSSKNYNQLFFNHPKDRIEELEFNAPGSRVFFSTLHGRSYTIELNPPSNTTKPAEIIWNSKSQEKFDLFNLQGWNNNAIAVNSSGFYAGNLENNTIQKIAITQEGTVTFLERWGNMLIIAYDKQLDLYAMEDNLPVKVETKKSKERITSAVVKDAYLAIGTADGSIEVFQQSDSDQKYNSLFSLPSKHKFDVTGLDILVTENSVLLATSGFDKKAFLVDVMKEKNKIEGQNATYSLFGHQNWIHGIQFITDPESDNAYVITYSEDGQVRVWPLTEMQSKRALNLKVEL
jgi:WD40 repeat protein